MAGTYNRIQDDRHCEQPIVKKILHESTGRCPEDHGRHFAVVLLEFLSSIPKFLPGSFPVPVCSVEIADIYHSIAGWIIYINMNKLPTQEWLEMWEVSLALCLCVCSPGASLRIEGTSSNFNLSIPSNT